MARTGRMASIFRNGRNQAVRIPKEFEFAERAVYVIKRGHELVLSTRPQDWSGLIESNAVVSTGFLRPGQWSGL